MRGSPAEAVSLVDRIGGGDTEAERELVERYAPPVRRLLRILTTDRWHAEDLLQETMTSVICRLRRRRLDDPAALEGYVKQTARKLILATYRKFRPSLPIPPELIDPKPGQLTVILREEVVSRVRRALSHVRPERYRELLERFYLAEESKDAICADLGLTDSHFHRVLFRARRRLRLELERREKNGERNPLLLQAVKRPFSAGAVSAERKRRTIMATNNPDFSHVSSPPSRISGRLPNSTPITQLGITAQAAKQLTPAAAKLNKGQLVELRENPGAAQSLGLNVADLNSIKAAFSGVTDPSFGRGVSADLSISCCSCTPCCCAASALTHQSKVA